MKMKHSKSRTTLAGIGLSCAIAMPLSADVRLPAMPAPGAYEGRFCAGEGDVDFLRLIDESFAFFNPNPIVPNMTMVYKPEWDTLVEAGGWNAWWIQNSYGFSYAATPFLQEPWVSLLQRSLDLFWDNQGDGKRKGGWEGPELAKVLASSLRRPKLG